MTQPTLYSYFERIDLKRAKKIANIDDDILLNCLGKEDLKDKEGRKIDKVVFCRAVKKFCNKHIKNKGENLKVDYKFSSTMVNNGRLHTIGFHIQNLQNKLRSYLCELFYYDLDMKNAHPAILYYLLKTYYPNHKWTFLETYINNRDMMLEGIDKDRAVAKNKILVSLNSEKPINTTNGFLKKLDLEFKTAQTLIFNEDNEFTKDLIHYKGLKKQNKKGSYLNMVLTCFENMVLQNATKCFDKKHVSSLIYDGFHISKDINLSVDEIINKCNESSEEYGIEWTHKEFSKDLDFIDDLEIEEKEDLSYEVVKQKFEEDYFMILSPLLFGREFTHDKKKTYSLHNFQDFKKITEFIEYENIKLDGSKEKKNFLTEWVKDKERRSYNHLEFCPVIKEDSESYNTFRGFDCDLPYEYTENPIAVEHFRNHLNHLTDHEEKSLIYLESYFADIIQNPDKPPGTAILLKSPQGHGKDLLMDIISKMLNISYVCRTEDIKDVLGNFNTAIKDKVICVINELEGKDGWEYRDKLKGVITTEYLNINEKGIKHYKQKNALRFFVMSNRKNPIEIAQDDRRFMVFKSHFKKPSTDYFNNLVKILNDKNSLYTIFNYLKNLKININLRHDRPTTSAYSNMKTGNADPVYNFVNDIIVNNNVKNYFDKNEYNIHKKTGDVLIKSTEFFQSYKSYLNQNQMDYLKPTFKILKKSLNEINIEAQFFTIKGQKHKRYRFNKKEISQRMEEMNIKEISEEFEDDEFEDNSDDEGKDTVESNKGTECEKDDE
jgi:hypothetical protein